MLKKSLQSGEIFFCPYFSIMKVILSFILLSIIVMVSSVHAQQCVLPNRAFNGGEQLSYQVKYNWGLVWVDAGYAKFTVDLDKIGSLPVYHFIGEGQTYPKYDWFYKVRDKFESYADTLELKPFRYIRNSNEGGTKVYNDNYFNFRRLIAYASSLDKKNRVIKDSVKITPCTKDVLTMIYHARNLNFSNYRVGDKIPVSLYLDCKEYPIYIRYAGKEKKKVGDKVYDCIRFNPKLIEGTIFKSGDEMSVWVTDDENRLPVYIETPIVVGSIKVSLIEAKGLRHQK